MTAGKKVVVFGLDGVPFGLLHRLFDQGIMPHLAETARSGSFLKMSTTQPPVSSVAWTSFMTGRNPGEHGIFGFTDVLDDRISVKLPSFDDIRSPTVWQEMGSRGKTSVIVNLPFTYPARPLNGVLVAGFVAPNLERSVYPLSLLPWLKSVDYRVDVDSVRGRQDRSFLIQDLFETLNLREQVMLQLMDSMPWDLFVGVVTGTDRLHHFFFDAHDDPGHPLHSDFLAYYSRVDVLFGKLRDRLGGNTRLIVLSDHGFAPLKAQVYVNNLLRQMGYLAWTRPDPISLEHMDSSSKAFAMDPSRIYLNSAQRFANGIMNPAEAVETRLRLQAELRRLRLRDLGIASLDEDDGPDDSLFDDVVAKEDIYSGDRLAFAPDLVLVPRRGYDLKARIGSPKLVMNDIFTGTHSHDDAFLIVNDPTVQERLPLPVITDAYGLITETFG